MVKKQHHAQHKHAEKRALELALAEKKVAAGKVLERFPDVSGMSIRLTYFSEMIDAVLMVRTVNYFPSSNAYFHINCLMKECSNGGFDLTRKIKEVVKNKKKSAKGDMVCGGGRGTLSSGHSRISYEIVVKYHKKGKKAQRKTDTP
jgi:hypothetical protein